MERELWNTIEGFGDLYMEMELVVAWEPILFVCTNKEATERYLVMTYNSADEKYVIVNISVRQLLKMLQNQITMEKTFRSSDAIWFTMNTSKDIIIAMKESAITFDAKKLPDQGAFYNIDSPYIKSYIDFLTAKIKFLSVNIENVYNLSLINYIISENDYSYNQVFENLTSESPLSFFAKEITMDRNIAS